jgi:hypothetical protein
MAVNALQSKLNKALTTNAAGDYALRTQTEGAQTMSSLTMTGDIDNGGNYLLDDQTTTNMMSKGTVYKFDGVDDDVTVTASGEITNIFDGGGFVSAQIYPLSDGEGDNGRVASKVRWDVICTSDDGTNIKITFYQSFSGTAGTWSTAVAVPLGTKSILSIAYNADSVANDPVMYINGVSVAVTEEQTPVGTRATDASDNFFIGNNSAGSRTFDGEIGEVILGNFAPTAAEVKSLISGNLDFNWQYGSQTEIIVNGTMAAGDPPDNWSATRATLATVSGEMQVTATDDIGYGKQDFTVVAGKKYKLSFDHWNTLGDLARYQLYDVSNSGDIIAKTSLSDTQSATGFSVEFTAPAGCTSARIILIAALNTQITYFDNVSVIKLGAVALYTQDSITANNWFDLANGNTGAVTGAEVLNPKGISTDEDNIPNFSITSGITADIGSAQGNGVLTASINQISVCGNAGDAVTLPAAKPGKVLWVFNDGANASDVFPASGDNIDEAGANTALSVAVNAEVQFVCTSAGHWSTITSA